MFVITDNNGVVQDRASHETNLSRGYSLAGAERGDDAALTAAGYKKVEINEDVRMFDSVIDGKVAPNVSERAKRVLPGILSEIIDLELKKDKATHLGFTSLVTEYQSRLDELNIAKAETELAI